MGDSGKVSGDLSTSIETLFRAGPCIKDVPSDLRPLPEGFFWEASYSAEHGRSRLFRLSDNRIDRLSYKCDHVGRMHITTQEIFIVIEIGGLALEVVGAFILAKEVWDRPVEVIEKHVISRITPLGKVKVSRTALEEQDQDGEGFFAAKSASKARLGFSFVAMGISLNLCGKLLELFRGP